MTHDLSGNPAHHISRRAFMGRSLAALTATLFAAIDIRALLAAGGSDSPALANWDRAFFAKHLNQKFTVRPGAAGDLALNLIAVQTLPAKIHQGPNQTPVASSDDCYALVFSGPANRPLRGRTYLFQHPSLGQFSLFIAPGKRASDGQHYEAVVNHVQA